jgi:hypothetical protein
MASATARAAPAISRRWPIPKSSMTFERSADALKEEFDYIERIDRLTTIAENRRNDALNEIEAEKRNEINAQILEWCGREETASRHTSP